MIVVSLCDFTCNIVQPWAEAGFQCYCIDIQHQPGETVEGNIHKIGANILDCISTWLPAGQIIKFAMAAPPCTHTAVSGARHFLSKGPAKAAEAFALIARCQQLLTWMNCPFLWEQPVSTTSTYCGPPSYTFNPCDYAGYLQDPEPDRYTKKTCIWTNDTFIMPEPKPLLPVKSCPQGSHLQQLGGPSLKTKNLRSATPKGFSKAVFLANNAIS